MAITYGFSQSYISWPERRILMKFFLWASGNTVSIQWKFQHDWLYRSRDIVRWKSGFLKNLDFPEGLAAKIWDGTGRDRFHRKEGSVLYILTWEWVWDLQYFACCDCFSERYFQVSPPIMTRMGSKEKCFDKRPGGNFSRRFQWHRLFSSNLTARGSSRTYRLYWSIREDDGSDCFNRNRSWQ